MPLQFRIAYARDAENQNKKIGGAGAQSRLLTGCRRERGADSPVFKETNA
jgi:hypothetical protein